MRYEIYFFDGSDIAEHFEDYETFEKLLEKGDKSLSDFGQLMCETDDIDAELDTGKYDDVTYDDMIAIWDNEEHIWFN